MRCDETDRQESGHEKDRGRQKARREEGLVKNAPNGAFFVASVRFCVTLYL